MKDVVRENINLATTLRSYDMLQIPVVRVVRRLGLKSVIKVARRDTASSIFFASSGGHYSSIITLHAITGGRMR